MPLVYKKVLRRRLVFSLLFTHLEIISVDQNIHYFCRSNHASLKKVKCKANKQDECFLRSAEQSHMISVTYTFHVAEK